MRSKPTLRYRKATVHDCGLLGDLNYQLIRDEGHHNPMSTAELEGRMRAWLRQNYEAVIFEDREGVAGYAVYIQTEERIHLRHFFIVRHRRRQGLGSAAMDLLRKKIWLSNRWISVDVLAANSPGMAFWQSLGFTDYCVTMELKGTRPPRAIPRGNSD